MTIRRENEKGQGKNMEERRLLRGKEAYVRNTMTAQAHNRTPQSSNTITSVNSMNKHEDRNESNWTVSESEVNRCCLI
jgi:hypothetical protein